MRRWFPVLSGLLLVALLAAPAASADPTKITAGDFRLKASGYNPVIERLDDELRTVSFGAVLDSANRSAVTGSGCRPGAAHQVAAFCWNSGDNGTGDWYPQGISTTADAYGSGTYEGRTAVFASWYYKGSGANKGVRVSFVDYANPSAPKYRHVLLVEPYDNGGRPDFRAVGVHAGGIFTYGYYLYVADTWGGFRAFDLRHLWQVSTGDKDKIGRQADGSYHAHNYAYVLPQALKFTASTTNGTAKLRHSAASLDRTSTPDSVVVPEYDSAGAGTRVVRFPIDYTDRMFKESADGYTHGSEAYRVDIKSMQGATAIDGEFFVSASAGSGSRGSLYTFTASSGPAKHSGAQPIGPEDLSYRGPSKQLWGLTEYPGKRFVYAVDPAKF